MDSYREIENLIYLYAEYVDGGDLQSCSQLLANAEYLGPDGSVVGRGADDVLAIQQRAVRIYEKTGTPCTRHITSNVIINVDEEQNRAASRSYFTVVQATDALSLQPVLTGRYRDAFQRVNGTWQFSSRQIIPELFGDLSHHLLFDFKP